ncbi:UNVERIFIED_CONTAM: hypothetical protein FKN15_074886 [Acipenser sinensis]
MAVCPVGAPSCNKAGTLTEKSGALWECDLETLRSLELFKLNKTFSAVQF